MRYSGRYTRPKKKTPNQKALMDKILYLVFILFFFQLFIIFFFLFFPPSPPFFCQTYFVVFHSFPSIDFLFLTEVTPWFCHSRTSSSWLWAPFLPFPKSISFYFLSLSCSLLYCFIFWLNFLFWTTLVFHSLALTRFQCSSPCFPHISFHLCSLQSNVFLSSCLCIQEKKKNWHVDVNWLLGFTIFPSCFETSHQGLKTGK